MNSPADSVPNDVPVADLLADNVPALRRYVRSRMGPALSAREASVDIVQSVCRELLQQGERFEDRGPHALRAWLQRAATRKILQKARWHRSPVRDIGQEAQGSGVWSQCKETAPSPSEEAVGKERLQRFERAYAALDPVYREIISLVRFSGLSHAEAAAIMRRTPESCRTLLRRALVQLSGLLEREDPS